jgi:hypothetical protein
VKNLFTVWLIAKRSNVTLLFFDKGQRAIVLAASSAQWPNNEVPYDLEKAFTKEGRAIIAAVSMLLYTYCSKSYLKNERDMDNTCS